MIDVAPASAIAALALQWFTKLKYMSKDSFGVIVGASVVKKEKFDQLSPEDQQALRDTSKRAAKALVKVVRRDDEKAYRVLVERGIEVLDTGPYRSEWESAARETRDRLAGRLFSKSLLAEVEAAAKGTGP